MKLSNVYYLFKLAQFFESSESFATFLNELNDLDVDQNLKSKLTSIIQELKSIYGKITGDTDIPKEEPAEYDRVKQVLELIEIKNSYKELKNKISDLITEVRKTNNEEFTNFVVAFLREMMQRVDDDMEVVDEDYEEYMRNVSPEFLDELEKEEAALKEKLEKIELDKKELLQRDITSDFESTQERDYLTRAIEFEEKDIQHRLGKLKKQKEYYDKTREQRLESKRIYDQKNKENKKKLKENLKQKDPLAYLEQKQTNKLKRLEYKESLRKVLDALKQLKVKEVLMPSTIDSLPSRYPEIINILGDDYNSILEKAKIHLRTKR